MKGRTGEARARPGLTRSEAPLQLGPFAQWRSSPIARTLPRMEHAEASRLGLAELREALASADARTRARAIERARDEPGVEQALMEALRDPDPGVRRSAVRRLGDLAGPRVARALIEVSEGDLSVSVRAEEVSVIGRLLEERTGWTSGEEDEPAR